LDWELGEEENEFDKVYEALKSSAPPPTPKGMNDVHGACSDNREETLSNEIAEATRTQLANEERIATLEDKVNQIQKQLFSSPCQSFVGASSIGPHNIPIVQHSEHHVSPQRQASPVRLVPSDGQR